MGVEWHIGCLKCKKYIWLGSMKISKWNGFQIGNEVVNQFLSMHTNNIHNCKLLIECDNNDYLWWEKPTEWEEDIISRSFWDSYSDEDQIKCGQCERLLFTTDTAEHERLGIMKNKYLWFCNDICFNDYLKKEYEEHGRMIYDSSNDKNMVPSNSILEVGCDLCNEFISIDNSLDEDGRIKDFEYLADFFIEHLGHQSILASFK